MIRPAAIVLMLLGAACASHRETPALYDLDSVPDPPERTSQLDAPIAIPQVNAPSWLRSSALVYRLDYQTPARPQAYAHSQWSAPPAELLTARLRELVTGVNSGFTTTRLGGDAPGYQLDVTLAHFEQVFTSPTESRSIVTLDATLTGRGGIALGQRTFHAERASPSGDAAGAVRGLVPAADDAIDQMIVWVRATLQAQRTNSVAEKDQPPISRHR
jgi:cholesterol transport system auxiliary component